MDRRELLKMIAVVTGGAFIGGEFFLSGCKNPEAGVSMAFTPDDIAYLDEIAETILPKTNTPGAKDAKVGTHMTVMVNDCYTENDQKTFHEGMKKLNDASKAMNNKSFMDSSPEQRKNLLISLDKEAKEYAGKKNDFDSEQIKKEKDEHDKGNTGYKREQMSAHYFSMMKQLTIAGFFTSKEGKTGALRYTPVPGKYDGNLDYKKGDKMFTGLS